MADIRMDSRDYLRGFADATGLSITEADAQAAAYCRQLSDTALAKEWDRKYDGGYRMGLQFLKQYKLEEDYKCDSSLIVK